MCGTKAFMSQLKTLSYHNALKRYYPINAYNTMQTNSKLQITSFVNLNITHSDDTHEYSS